MDKIPNESILNQNMGKIAYTLDKAYFERLTEDYTVIPFDETYNVLKNGETNIRDYITYPKNIRAVRIGRLVYDKDESTIDCVQNVLNNFSSGENTIAFIFTRKKESTEIYAIVKNEEQGGNDIIRNSSVQLKNAIEGNFPGSDVSLMADIIENINTDIKAGDKITLEKILFPFEPQSISAVCNIPSGKSEKYLSQGMEKLLNGVVPEKNDEAYSVIVLAESLDKGTIQNMLEGFEELSTSIHPFLTHQFQLNENKAESTGETKSLATSDSTSHSINKTHSVNVSVNGSIMKGIATTKSTAINVGVSLFKHLLSIGGTKSKSITENRGNQVGASLGYGYSWGTTDTVSKTKTESVGNNHSITLGSSETTTYTYQSYTVKNLLDKLEIMKERLQKGKALGLWRYSTYVFAANSEINKRVSNFVKSLTQGEDSYIESSDIVSWDVETGNGKSDFDEIVKYVKRFCHPVFINIQDGTPVTFSNDIHTFELANAIALPHSSVPGIPVTKAVAFGREPYSLIGLKNNIDIGCAYHMYKTQEANRIYVSKQELTKHTFITGSTGSGKSNTVYKLLGELEADIPFLVIEPAKGEYKNVFIRDDVHVYGSNNKLTDILKINPFEFPNEIHVLEHLDRLVEIFNVCWPMYAAMPAILKEAFERAYISSGWDLLNSSNEYGRLFPTFSDVLREVTSVLEESEYSEDNKGDYTGALCTRIRSLTNGLNGIIFQSNSIPNEDLFDKKVIVDISRIGSTETKSLIMGILVMKLQEYRMSKGSQNDELRHVTVLEEAHNILKKTSTEQSADSPNLSGKSVEMIANAIAEMRTYGEGFIIVDQAPQLMDMSVIRNTNTKIVLRLPDQADRELVGRAMGLTDDQIDELSRLRRGVAAVSQSDWIEAVLCDIDEFKYNKNQRYNKPTIIENDSLFENRLKEFVLGRELYKNSNIVDDEWISTFKERTLNSKISGKVKYTLLKALDNRESKECLQKLAYEFFDAQSLFKSLKSISDVEVWIQTAIEKLRPDISDFTQEQVKYLLVMLVSEQAERDVQYNEFLKRFAMYVERSGGGIH